MITEDRMSELDHLAAEAPSTTTTRAKSTDRINESPESLRAYLESHGVNVVLTKSGTDGETIFGVSPCPMNDDHKDGAAIILAADGKIGFKCHHNGCRDVGWKTVRQRIDPEYDPESKRPKSQATELVDIAERAALFHDAGVDGYVTVAVGDHGETWPVRSKQFKRWLSRKFFEAHKKAPGSQAISDALTVIEGHAIFGGPEIGVHLRVAEHGGMIYVDLCNDVWQAVEISTSGWRVVESRDVPIKFRRTPGMLALPRPVRGGSLSVLRGFLNVGDGDDSDWALLTSWLIGALNPTGPYPVLAVSGEQGSAKSTACRMLRALIDPNKAALRSEPRGERDLVIAANNGRVIGLDNLSHISPWLSDALCRISTGGGFATRELYSDMSEVIFDSQRPIIINGITELATRSDLLDRCIQVTLQMMPEEQRRRESELWSAFNAASPRILGGLFDVISRGLRNHDSVKLERLPRMADFAQWIVACEPATPWRPGTFLAAYMENRAETHELVIEGCAVATVLRQWMTGRPEWEGTATELLGHLNSTADDRTKSTKDWPKSPPAVGTRLRQVAPNLRAVGIDLTFHPSKRKRTIIVRQVEQNAVTAVTAVTDPPSATKNSDSGDSEETAGDSKRLETLSPVNPLGIAANGDGDSGDGGDSDSHTQSCDSSDGHGALQAIESEPEPEQVGCPIGEQPPDEIRFANVSDLEADNWGDL